MAVRGPTLCFPGGLDCLVQLVFPGPDFERSCSGLIYNPTTHVVHTRQAPQRTALGLHLLATPACTAQGLALETGSAGDCDMNYRPRRL